MTEHEPRDVLAPDFLAGLGTWETSHLRERRAACERREAAVSYARRVLQGRVDIVRAELERRGAGDGDVGHLVDRLPAVLAGDHVATDPLRARATRLEVPEEADALVAELGPEVDASALAGRDAAELEVLLDRLRRAEAELSVTRQALFERIDRIRDELAARYKDGRADVGDLLSGADS
ncbi:aerial mycelium formation protein [Nitriliruptoraceae bacterium ZYF776]|nr:aerial mycelium formation protein [Profundirhabdus halotolerans]